MKYMRLFGGHSFSLMDQGGGGGGARDAPTLGPILFQFHHAVFGRKWSKYIIYKVCAPLFGNPGSVTVSVTYF